MAEIKKNVLTQEGLKRYEEELQDLSVHKRKEIADKIKEAREQGDLSENAEYDAAKDEQRDIEARIGELEELLKHAEVYVTEETPIDRVGIGSLVKVLDIDEDEELTFKIVGNEEADSMEGRISNESPLGAALLGKEVGEQVTVELPAGDLSYRVLSITKESSDE